MARIFISYRRDDAGYVASMLRERLEEEFGAGSVFMDIENIVLGVDFRRQLSEAVATCDVLVALIGETWAGPMASGPERRIDNPEDFVRIEIEAALKRGIPVVPVLIDKAQLPPAQALPESLRELSFRHAAELRAGRDLKAHLDTLCQGLRARLGPPADARPAAPVAERPSVTVAPPPRPGVAPPLPPEAQAAPARSTSTVLWASGGAAVLLAAAAGWWATRPAPAGAPPAPKLAQAPPAVQSPKPVPTPAPTPSPAPGNPMANPAASPPAPAATADSDPRSSAAEVLQGYKIAIFFPAGDTAAGQTARAIRDLLAARGVERGVELRLATAEKLRQLVPAESLEVRFDAGREEEQARLLASLLGGKPLRRTPVLKPVPSDEPTPNFISVFVPAGG